MSSAVGVSAEEELGSASYNEQGEEQHHPKRRVLSKRLSGPRALWCPASGDVGPLSGPLQAFLEGFILFPFFCHAFVVSCVFLNNRKLLEACV